MARQRPIQARLQGNPAILHICQLPHNEQMFLDKKKSSRFFNLRSHTMQVKKIAGALGAELSDVDLRQALSPAQAEDIRAALLDHQVIFLRKQNLSPQQFLNFANAMGEPIDYPFLKGLPEFPQIIEVKKLEHETSNFGGIWHSDTTYLKVPPMGSMLLSREVPPCGGDTLFANQTMAYETLSSTMKQMLAPLLGIASSAKADVSKTREDRIKSDGTGKAIEHLLAE